MRHVDRAQEGHACYLLDQEKVWRAEQTQLYQVAFEERGERVAMSNSWERVRLNRRQNAKALDSLVCIELITCQPLRKAVTNKRFTQSR
jgi:hypothetical protein